MARINKILRKITGANKKIVSKLMDMGYVIVRMNRHIIMKNNNKNMVIVSCSPSDRRTYQNVLSQANGGI